MKVSDADSIQNLPSMALIEVIDTLTGVYGRTGNPHVCTMKKYREYIDIVNCFLVMKGNHPCHCTPCLKKTVQNCFCHNFVKFPPILIIFGRKIAKRLKLCEVYSFSTSPNLHHYTAVLNADVPNCYTML